MGLKPKPRSKDELPGPGKYNSINEYKYKKFNKKGFVFGKLKRLHRPSNGLENLGPGSYNGKFVGRKGLGGGFSFGSGQRSKLRDNKVPGPGTYSNGFKVKKLKK